MAAQLIDNAIQMFASPIAEKSHRCQILVRIVGSSASWLSPDVADVSWLEEEQMKFNFFVAKLGVLAKGSYSIDHRLRKNKPVSRAIDLLLDALLADLSSLRHIYARVHGLQDGLEDSKPLFEPALGAEAEAEGECGDTEKEENDSDTVKSSIEEVKDLSDDELSLPDFSGCAGDSSSQTSSAELLKESIVENIASLLRYAVIIRKYTSKKSDNKGESYSPTTSDDEGGPDSEAESACEGDQKLSVRFAAHIDVVLEKEFTPGRFEQDDVVYLKHRLHGSMMRRWRRICYRHKHAERLASRMEMIQEKMVDQNGPADTIPPKAKGAHPGSASTLLDKKITAGDEVHTQSSKVSGATTLAAEFSISEQTETKSHSVKSASRIGSLAINEPPIPRCKTINQECFLYDCPFCCQLPMTRAPFDRRLWRAHLWTDLSPYVCLFEPCQSAYNEYTTFHAWSEHVKNAHGQSHWLCERCDGSKNEYTTEQSFISHFMQNHGRGQDEAEIRLIAKYSRRHSVRPQCVICGSEAIELQSWEEKQQTVESCMAGHLQALALGSLPWHLSALWDDDSSSKAESGASDQVSLSSVDFGFSNDLSPDAVSLETIALNAESESHLSPDKTVSMWDAKGPAEQAHDNAIDKAIVHCSQCDYTGYQGEQDFACPACRSENIEVVKTGDNLRDFFDQDAEEEKERFYFKDDPSPYRIGIACALVLEMMMVRTSLDEEKPQIHYVAGDTHEYLLGRVGGHSVVVACPPASIYEPSSAAGVAVHMMRGFPSIEYMLVVGVGGGVPSDKADIRLGDVVVGVPTRGNQGDGRCMLDLGKSDVGTSLNAGASANSELPQVQARMLNNLPRVLLSAVSSARAKPLEINSRMLTTLAKIRAKFPGLKDELSYPGWENDRLFTSNYEHVDSENCENCEPEKMVDRKPRTEQDGVEIHYGGIASVNGVVTHAKTRDHIVAEQDVLCIEMEAWGLPSACPSLLIRGISDYTDSHKNNKWQPYAAATAAVYAKILIGQLPIA